MRNLNNNSPSTFTLSSNNHHVKFNSTKTINGSELYNDSIIKKYKENLNTLIFILDQNKYLQNRLIRNITVKEEESNQNRNNYESTNYRLNNSILKFFLNSKNEIFFIVINRQRIYASNFIINKYDNFNQKLIFDLSQINRIYIQNYFIPNNNPDNFIYILLSNNIIIQIDYTKNSDENNNLIQKIFEIKLSKAHSKKSKEDEEKIKDFNITEYECQINKEKQFSYLLYKFQNKKSNINFCIRFPNNNEDQEILFFSIYKNKYLVLALNGGKVRLISLETFKILSQYKSNFGQISSISFSFDGNLLGIGAQDNNGYIINLNSLNLISCLEGHENYISKMIFELQKIEDYNNNQNNLNDILINRTNSININKKTKFQKVDKEKILTYWKNTHNKDPNEKRNVYRKMSTMKRIIQNPLDKIYDIYTCGLDGKIGSYRIEYINTNNINGNNNNGHNISNNNDDDDGCIPTSRDNEEYIENKNNILHFSKKIYELKNYIYLNPPKNNDDYEKAHFDFMNPIINEPIIDFFKIDLFTIIACKVNITGSEVKLIFFDGELDNENLKDNNKNDSNNPFNSKFNLKNNLIDNNKKNNNNNNNNTNTSNNTRNSNLNKIFNKSNNSETSISSIASQVDELNKTSVKPKQPK